MEEKSIKQMPPNPPKELLFNYVSCSWGLFWAPIFLGRGFLEVQGVARLTNELTSGTTHDEMPRNLWDRGCCRRRQQQLRACGITYWESLPMKSTDQSELCTVPKLIRYPQSSFRSTVHTQ
eukprot:2991058-Amphidinium_carterae.1